MDRRSEAIKIDLSGRVGYDLNDSGRCSGC